MRIPPRYLASPLSAIRVTIPLSPTLKPLLEILQKPGICSVALIANSCPPVQPLLRPGSTRSPQKANSNVDNLRAAVSPEEDRRPAATTVVPRDTLRALEGFQCRTIEAIGFAACCGQLGSWHVHPLHNFETGDKATSITGAVACNVPVFASNPPFLWIQGLV